jgi:hypothetical protein
MGDVCTVKIGTFKGRNIINEVQMQTAQDFEYSTDRGAWIPHEQLTLVENSNINSLTELAKSINDGEEE